jgi:hypothetical protein
VRQLIIFVAFLTVCPLLLGAKHVAKSAIDKHIHQHSAILGRTEFGKRESGETDLDRDGKKEIAVLYALGMGNDALWFFAIFEEDDSEQQWHLVNQIYLGGRGLRHIEKFVVKKDSVVIDAREFQGDDSYSSPTLKVKLKISSKHGLLDIDRKIDK